MQTTADTTVDKRAALVNLCRAWVNRPQPTVSEIRAAVEGLSPTELGEALGSNEDIYGRSALHHASYLHPCAAEICAELLWAGADPHVRDGGGRTPLHMAVGYRSTDTPHPVSVLVVAAAYGLARTGSPDPASRGKYSGEAVRALVSAVSNVGVTPLMLAASKGPVKMVEMLLRLGADPWQDKARNPPHRSARAEARRSHRADVVAILEKAVPPTDAEVAGFVRDLAWTVVGRTPPSRTADADAKRLARDISWDCIDGGRRCIAILALRCRGLALSPDGPPTDEAVHCDLGDLAVLPEDIIVMIGRAVPTVGYTARNPLIPPCPWEPSPH